MEINTNHLKMRESNTVDIRVTIQYLFSALCFILLSGCASSTVSTVKPFDRVVIVNHTGTSIDSAFIYAKSTNQRLNYGYLPKDGYCEYKFIRSKKVKNRFKIVWTSNKHTYIYDDIIIPNLNLKKNSPVNFSVNLLNNGKYLINQN